MKISNLKEFTRGWIVGDFEPSIIRSKNFEFMVRNYAAGESEQKHVHKIAHEITVITSGKFRMNEQDLIQGDVVHLAPGDPADFLCIEAGATAVVKTPSIIGDKYLI